MVIEKIIHRKYKLNGNNNPTDYFMGYKRRLEPREKGKCRIYFLDMPEHGNMGDQAIALAMVEFAEKYKSKYELVTFSISHILEILWAIKKDCRRGDVFFLIGGGNMGIEYFANEETRRIIIEMFPRNRIIIFPQTIDYSCTEEGKKELKNAVKLYGKHPDLHIFARERVSYDYMKKNFIKNNIYLTPDIVYSLEYEENFERKNIGYCIRTDRESSLTDKQRQFIECELKEYGEVVKMETVEKAIPLISSENIRKTLVWRKLKEFAESRFVVTDRLHGMIFSYITRTPCFVLPSYNHKVTSSYSTWLKQCDYIMLLDDINILGDEIEKYFKNKNGKNEQLDLENKFEMIGKLLEG